MYLVLLFLFLLRLYWTKVDYISLNNLFAYTINAFNWITTRTCIYTHTKPILLFWTKPLLDRQILFIYWIKWIVCGLFSYTHRAFRKHVYVWKMILWEPEDMRQWLFTVMNTPMPCHVVCMYTETDPWIYYYLFVFRFLLL